MSLIEILIVEKLILTACDPELMPSFPQHRLKRKAQPEKER